MDIKKVAKFLVLLIFRDWGIFGLANIVTIIGFIITPLINPTWNIIMTISIFISIIVFLFIAKTIKQFYNYFDLYLIKLKIESIVSGEGAYLGNYIMKLEYSEHLQKDMLLTLYSGSSGINQPICILKIISIEPNNSILAVQLMPSEKVLNISIYYNEEVRKKSLFALPIVTFDNIQKFEVQEDN